MKRVFIVSLFVILLLFSCNDDNDDVGSSPTAGDSCSSAGAVECSAGNDAVLVCQSSGIWAVQKTCNVSLGYFCVDDHFGPHCADDSGNTSPDSGDSGNTANSGSDTGNTGDSADTTDSGDSSDSVDSADTIDSGNTSPDTGDTGNSSPDTANSGNTGDSADTADSGNSADSVDSANTTDSGDTSPDTGNTGDSSPDTADSGNSGNSGDSGDTVVYPPDDPNELISDRHFSTGFIAMNAEGHDTGTMSPGFVSGSPVWHLGQWGSHSDLSEATPTTLSDGAVEWADGNGHVIVGKPGTEHSDLSFFVDGLHQYNNTYYDPNDTTDGRTTWVHLLVEQSISSPGAAGAGTPPLSELASLPFSVNAKLLFDHQNRKTGYNDDIHAAQYLIYFTIQNLNTSSGGYGDYVWFGMRLYDDRESYPDLMVAGDDATGKLIYNIGIRPLSPSGLGDNQWHYLHGDLLPHIRLALKEAWSRGYIPKSRVLSDYKIGGMNIGWECSGLNNTEMQIKDLSLTYTKKAAPEIRYDFNTDGDKEGWTTNNLNDLIAGGPKDGYWVMQVPGNDPMMIGPEISINAASYHTISITIANDHNPVANSVLQVFWQRFGDQTYTESKSVQAVVNNGGGYVTLTFNMSDSPAWTGEITRLRVDPILSGDGSHAIGIDSIVIKP